MKEPSAQPEQGCGWARVSLWERFACIFISFSFSFFHSSLPIHRHWMRLLGAFLSLWSPGFSVSVSFPLFLFHLLQCLLSHWCLCLLFGNRSCIHHWSLLCLFLWRERWVSFFADTQTNLIARERERKLHEAAWNSWCFIHTRIHSLTCTRHHPAFRCCQR